MIKIVSKTDLVKCIKKVRNAGDKERSNDRYKQASILVLFINDEIKKNSFVAIGEIGIDLYWDKTTLDIQKEAFETQVKIAKEKNLPIVIHTRNSFEEAYEIVEKLNDKNLSGVFHCFSGNLDDAKKIIELENFYLGIGGVVTFKNGGIDKIINQISLEHIILETWRKRSWCGYFS